MKDAKSDNFRVTVIDPETFPLFRHLFPTSLWGLADLPEALFLGAVYGSGRDTEAVGGALLFGKEEEELCLKWLYVDEDYRGNECGSLLLDRVYDAAEALRSPAISVCLPMGEDGSFQGEDFFEEMGFLGIRGEGTLYEGEAALFAPDKVKKGFRGQILTLAELSKEQKKALEAFQGAESRRDLPDLLPHTSLEYSLVCVQEEVPKAAVLVAEGGRVFFVLSMGFAPGVPEEEKEVLEGTLLRELTDMLAEEQNNPMISVFVPNTYEGTGALREMVKDVPGTALRFLTAGTEELIKLEEEEKQRELLFAEESIDLPPLPSGLQVEEVIYMTDV